MVDSPNRFTYGRLGRNLAGDGEVRSGGAREGISGNAYDPDVWAAGLDYAHRSIQAEVELFCAIRSHIGGLLKHLPDAMDRTVSLSSGHIVSVRQRIEPLMGHALHHIGQILETRKVHGV